MATDKKEKRIRKQVKDLKNFYTHLAVYFAVMVLLFVIDYQDAGNWWVHYPAIGWGIAVVVQGVSIGFFSTSWEDKKVKELMEKEE